MTTHGRYTAYTTGMARRLTCPLRWILLFSILITPFSVSHAQITISGKVFGGARQANVGGSTFVNIGAEKFDVIIDAVYGGNDIAGSIGTSETIPTDIFTEAVDNGVAGTPTNNQGANKKSINTFVRTNEEAAGKHLFIGNLFGGGYGNYEYTRDENTQKYEVKTWDVPQQTVSEAVSNLPEVASAYIELCGGTFGYVYGGGDSVTVAQSTDICIKNTSTPWDLRGADTDDDGDDAISNSDLKRMIINTAYFDQTGTYNFSRVFGGNNRADMSIQPAWHLKKGKIENLYSGGNEGRMTSPTGLLLNIDAGSEIDVTNVYGGCRKADVCPEISKGVPAEKVQNLTGYNFPDNLAARVLINGGKIQNVYGGNDVRGRVYFGNAVGIYTSITGNVYGGGNGSYPYTDNPQLANDLIYGDFYYNPTAELTKAGVTPTSGLESVTALNLIRPNAEQVSIRIADNNVTDETTDEQLKDMPPVIIGGSVYCGGNSATLKMDPAHVNISANYPMVELKIGSNIILNEVFLGNNGANMVDQSDDGLLATYHGDVKDAERTSRDFSTLDLTDSSIFAEYMKGCAMDIIPRVNFDDKAANKDRTNYREYSAYIGSFYCGGNVGSMTYNDVKPMNFNRKFIIFDKLVGGCNNAVIPEKPGVNALYEGGITGAPNSTTGNKVELILSGIKMEPKRWKNPDDKTLGLTWNTIYASSGSNTPAVEAFTDAELSNLVDLKDKENNPVLDDEGHQVKYLVSSDDDLDRRFRHGHVYGGCYSSGIVNGNVVINIDGHLIEREKLFDEVVTDELGEEESLYGSNQTEETRFKITKRHTGVILGQQGMDVLGAALNVFGGGKGKATEIWGSTTINLNKGYTFQIFGGSEEGVIGKPNDGTGDDYTYSYKLKYFGTDDETGEITKTYKYKSDYSCYVNLCGKNAGVSKQADTSEDMAQCEFMYGGGFFGPICGNTYVNLGNGRIFNSFAGSCNADILGHTETYIGRSVKAGTVNQPYLYKDAFAKNATNPDYYEPGFPWVRDYTYGGNDLGGLIKGQMDFTSKVRTEAIGKVHLNNATEVLTANAYTEYLQGRAEGIFAGCYGTYNYTDSKFDAYFYTTGENIGTARPGYSKPYMANAIVNFRPTYSQDNNWVNKIFGAGQGYPGEKDRDHLQDRSYVLIDIPQDMTYYKEMEVFGAGAWGGVGMTKILWPNLTPDEEELKELDGHSAIIDLVRGQIGAAYGGSYEEGITRRTVVNVPSGSTIMAGSIFGGAYGTKTLPSCDVLESNVEYHSADAVLIYDPNTSVLYQGSLYGGNNKERRTLSTYVNVDVPVVQKKVIQYDKEVGSMLKGDVLWTNGTVYGAGRGENTWSEYTMVNLQSGAKVWEVYGGGQMGHVLNAQSVQAYMQAYKEAPSPDIDPSEYEGVVWATAWQKAWTMDNYYTPNDGFNNYADFIKDELKGIRPRTELLEQDPTDPTDPTKKIPNKTAALLGDGTTFFNTNVIINEGATVANYAYGGGLGKSSVANSGDVWGTTYIALLGGTVKKDLYAAGTSGGVCDAFNLGAYDADTNPLGFTASANAYIKGGTARNVYGGGWEGSVGKHKKIVTDENEKTKVVNAGLEDSYHDDVYGETHVVIGDLDGTSFTSGLPAIERNAYGGGEGGAVWGTANITIRNGFIGYRHFSSEPTTDTDLGQIQVGSDYFQEKLHDETWTGDGTNRLYDSGCIFGGGYIDNSSVDVTNVKMYGGYVRNALFGGGEIAAIGRGIINASGTDNSIRTLQGIYKAGKTSVELYDGEVHRNVFGGGRGYNNLGQGGKLYSDGYVFGQTEVRIHGGQVGTMKELALGNGNVFGGGDIGYVYSAYELSDGTLRRGIKSGTRFDGDNEKGEGYYYEHKGKTKAQADETLTTGIDDEGFILYNNGKERKLTEDCKVLVEPHCKVTASGGLSYSHTYNVGDVFTVSDINFLRNYKANHSTWGTNVDDIAAKVDVKGKVTSSFSLNIPFAQGEYVPTFVLNSLGNREDDEWEKLEANTNYDGITILNAVFAGGNTSAGSSKAFANATSVYGNATASIHDVYHRDLISIGTGQTGGLYGDGNLTFVDGYRGLNITNYGTDYNFLYRNGAGKELSYNDYLRLLAREQDYYEIRYKCVQACTDKDGTSYHPEGSNYSSASTLSGDQIMALFKNVWDDDKKEYTYTVPAKNGYKFYNDDGSINTNTDPSEGDLGYWVQSGVCSIYAGRLLNTIQRADFCGVFGSRMVMKGAQDRVPEVVDYTNYTINRVREVSLNKKKSIISTDTGDNASHGNYFGIYNIVNYLGALTSDFDFGDQGTDTDEHDAAGSYTEIENGEEKTKYYTGDIGTAGTGGVRTSDNTRTDEFKPDYVGQTFYGWKRAHHDEQKRNNGNSHNKVALASGVYLELTTEESTGKEFGDKVWGPITGVVELDLINVQPGIGGGFVYAKNIHGKRERVTHDNTTLTALNAGAVTRFDFNYSTTEDNAHQRQWQTSGNFVHSTQIIIDDCYDVSGKYMGSDKVPAHYWYIKGKVYVYDQYISAYTGISNAYSETVNIPLTISAASNGTMTLLQVQPNKYAYKNTSGTKLEEGKKIIINDVEYYLNDPINYWDWYRLTPSEQALFVDETYVISDSCKIGDNWYAPGYVMNEEDYNSFKTSCSATTNPTLIYKASKDADGNNIVVQEKDSENNLFDVTLAFDDVFHSSNNMSHNTGYMLTYKVNNPVEWNTWYTKESSATHEKQQTEAEGYHNGPTFYLTGYGSDEGTLLGQRSYKVGDLISADVETTYKAVVTNHSTAIPTDDPNAADYDADKVQATFEKAYILTKEETVTEGGATHHLQKGHVVSATDVSQLGLGSSVVDAYICTQSIQLSPTRFIYVNNQMTASDKDNYIKEVNDSIKKIHSSLARLTNDDLKNKTELSDFDVTGMTDAQKKALSTMLTLRSSIDEHIIQAYYCTAPGLYGGNYYEGNKNYRGLEVFSSMTETDRNQFSFNYDALDLLVDPTFGNAEGKKYQYDSKAGTLENAQRNLAEFYTAEDPEVIAGTKQVGDVKTPAGYSIEAPVDYTATYNGSSTDTEEVVANPEDPENPLHKHYMSTAAGKVYRGAELDRKTFEALPNERRHYAPIMVKDEDVADGATYTVYVVHSPDLVIGNEPYAIGSTITAADYTDDLASYVTRFDFTTAGTYYYCRESYKVGEKGNGISVTNTVGTAGFNKEGESVTIKSDAYGNNEIVPIGLVINSATYGNLVNKQLNFTIHGKAPTETSTLYVSRFSDIKDLSTEKVITVIYRYDYEESDRSGNHITPVSERHVVNIHIQFKSGLPEVGEIKAPQIVIPGDYVGLREPHVVPGATEITGGGWELYERREDAESRTNAIPFTPTLDPLYWYQNDYYVRYYCLTNIGGKSYSNFVPISVANYHDLKEVMDDKTHHYYIDHANVDRDPKIYISDYSSSGQNGLDLLKNLFDLSAGKTLTGHSTLNTTQVGNSKNLQFFLKANQSYTDTEADDWTPIGSDDDPSTSDVNEYSCFEGVLHGDGYTISGLDNSLFKHLCGEVYNLGVTGSFTGAGIAEDGSGYVENTWVSTSTTKAKTNKPVFGNPSRTDEQKAQDGEIQIVNSYYQEEDDADATKNIAYTNHSGNYGIPTRMPARAFYNGTVAYNLNGFYLYKRYNDHLSTPGSTPYKYYTDETDATTGALVPHDGYYASNPDLCSSGYRPSGVGAGYIAPKYVEDRFADGDFIYSGGYPPEEADKRLYTDATTEAMAYYPVWPDDYLFFGQTLDYGFNSGRTHQDVPSRYATTNRVLRAPAYFRSYDMSMAHFNADAVLAGKEKLTFEQINDKVVAREAYPRMTAIDFTGYNDIGNSYQKGWAQWSKTSQLAQSSGKSSDTYAFYPPLLDDGVVNSGLNSFTCGNLTPNLLVYTGAPDGTGANETPTATQQTANVVSAFLPDAAFSDYVTDNTYHTTTVKPWDSFAGALHGHWVRKNVAGTDFIATRDHFLVDKEDFNAPMAYTFQRGQRMWHQRIPENYVENVWVDDDNNDATPLVRTTKGWEAISLPFTVELVTTNDKGEITHFYKKQDSNNFEDNYDTGHEYWLREFSALTEGNATSPATANFEYPALTGDGSETVVEKTVENTFLWNYYYEGFGHEQKDRNLDKYQTYYESSRTYYHYPLLTKAVPYIIGFPGVTYYEFDLSGGFAAGTTAETKPEQLGQQTITFASATTGITIGVSDNEMTGVPEDGYIFKPSYLNDEFAAGTNNYTLAADGGSYEKVPAASSEVTVDPVAVYAFRPYFTKAAGSRSQARSIVFSNVKSQFGIEDEQHDNAAGSMTIRSGKHKVVVTSNLKQTADVRIFNVSGLCIASFNIEPGQTVEQPVHLDGIYIVRAADGRYTRKLSVK